MRENHENSILFYISVPPKLNPFHLQILSLNVGDRASIPCSVVKGDLPISIKWLKNKSPIDPGQGISITQVDHYNSILVIDHLTAVHSSNYTCTVSNPAASMESSQMLLVNGKLNGFKKITCGVIKGANERKINIEKPQRTKFILKI